LLLGYDLILILFQLLRYLPAVPEGEHDPAVIGVPDAPLMWSPRSRGFSEIFDRRLDYILGASDDPSPAPKPGEGEIQVMGNWIVQEEYEDVMRKFTLLDEFGQKAVSAVLRAEFARCQEQSTLRSGRGVSVTVKIREVQDPINEDLPD